MPKIKLDKFLSVIDDEYLPTIMAASQFISSNNYPLTRGEVMQHLMVNMKHQEVLDNIRHSVDYYANTLKSQMRKREEKVREGVFTAKKLTKAEIDSELHKDATWSDLSFEVETLALCSSRIGNLVWMLKSSYSFIAGVKF